MSNKLDLTWDPDPNDIIMLINTSSRNYILELPAGRYRLDAGRKMRTLRSILDIDQVKRLIDAGDVEVTVG